MPIAEIKTCSRCGQSKSVADFYWKRGKPAGWCKDCYRDWHRARYVPQVPVPEHQTCTVCGKEYTPKQRRLSKFCSVYCRNQARIAAERAMRDEVRARLKCEECGGPLPVARRKRGRTKFCSDVCAQKARQARQTPEERAAWRFQHKYGITLGQRAVLLKEQGGGCAICGTKRPGSKGWALDHDHACCGRPSDAKTCGKCIRGVLCGRCNLAIGLFDDDPERLRVAAKYLKRKSK